MKIKSLKSISTKEIQKIVIPTPQALCVKGGRRARPKFGKSGRG